MFALISKKLFLQRPYLRFLRISPEINEIMKITKNIKNKIFAMLVAPAAIPPNPKKAAIIAIIKNTKAQ